MTGKYFRSDGIRGVANSGRMAPETVLKIAMAAGRAYQGMGHRACRHWQGYAPVRLLN